MITRRLTARLSTSASALATRILIRPFSSTLSIQRSPALSDVQPDNAAAFDSKQEAFRQSLVEQQKRKKEQERQSAQSPSSAKSSSPSRSSTTAYLDAAGLDSLSLSAAGDAQRQQEAEGRKTGGGRLSSLIYGTEEGREMDREIERSFSQVLARGKYVHSIVFHQVKPKKVDEYVDLVGRWYPKVANDPNNKVNLVGSWRTEVGECDTFGEDCYNLKGVACDADVARDSAHLGIPTLRRLPRLAAHDPASSRIRRVRPEA